MSDQSIDMAALLGGSAPAKDPYKGTWNLALQRAGAAFQGNLGEFDANRTRTDMLQREESRQFKAETKALSLERATAAAQDAQIALQFLKMGAKDKALQLVDNRLGFIKQFGGDPSDTQAVRDLIAADKIDEAMGELSLFATAAEARGMIKPLEKPQAQSVEGKRTADERAGLLPTGMAGTLNALKSEGAASAFGKIEDDFKSGRIDRQTYDALKRKELFTDAPRDTFADAAKLRGEFDTKTKDFSTVRDAYSKMASVAQDPSAAGDISLIFGFMKLNDPASTVREGEFATAQNAGSIPERLRARYNAAINGETLTATQRADFMKQAGSIYGSQENQFRKEVERYSDLAKKFGTDPSTVVYDRAEGVKRVSVGMTPPSKEFPQGQPVYEIDGKLFVDKSK